MIPGHGGIMDRFDCQFLMATFVNVYISSFIRTASPQKLLALVSRISFVISLHLTFKKKEEEFTSFVTWRNENNVFF